MECGNLFGITGNEISKDFEFTEERGYNETVKSKKIEYLAKGIKLLRFNKPIVEDNNPFLKFYWYKVDTFTAPIDALYSFRKDVYDLVLLDLKTPKMNGLKSYQEFHNIDPTII